VSRKFPAAARFLVVLALIVTLQRSGFSHLEQYTPVSGGTPHLDQWDLITLPMPVWNLNPNTMGTKVTGTRTVDAVIQASFDAWNLAPNTILNNTPLARGKNTSNSFTAQGGVNTISFLCTGSNCDFTKDAETLGETFTYVANAAGQPNLHGGTTLFAGQIIDADILFNPNTAFSTDGPSSNVIDLQTVATHEIGHFFGMDHSAVVRAVMFPFAPDTQHELSYDDVAGISNLYPKTTPDVPTGTIAGHVMQQASGTPVFGAHVYADSTVAGNAFAALGFNNIRKTPIGTLTQGDGSYTLTGLPADSYIIVAEPVDDPVTNGDICNGGAGSNDYCQDFGSGQSLQTNFTTRWH
jgi:hypothetical protein